MTRSARCTTASPSSVEFHSGADFSRLGASAPRLELHIPPRVGQPILAAAAFYGGFGELQLQCHLVFGGRAPGPLRRLLEAFLSVCRWVDVYFGGRPNLRDEGDNHLIELAVVAGANWIVTNNVADFRGGEPRFPDIRIATPGEYLKETMR